MNYLLSFLEGIISFISPCLLPMIPIYLIYIEGGADTNPQPGKDSAPKPLSGFQLRRALSFVLGFTLVFVALGAFAGTLGRLLLQYQTAVNIVSGILVILFGLSYLGVFRLPFLHKNPAKPPKIHSAAGAVLFGAVFAIGWPPCVGAFLGSALMLASSSGSVLQGVILLLCYSAGLGIPFVLSALLLDKMNTAFAFIKKHYTVINRICGVFLLVVGVLMATGLLSRWLTALSRLAS